MPHITRDSEEGKTEEAKTEEGITAEEPAAAEGAGAAAAGDAAAASTEDTGKDAAAAAAESEPEIVPTYETEMKHVSIDHFKNAMGLFVDNFKLSYASTNFSV